MKNRCEGDNRVCLTSRLHAVQKTIFPSVVKASSSCIHLRTKLGTELLTFGISYYEMPSHFYGVCASMECGDFVIPAVP